MLNTIIYLGNAVTGTSFPSHILYCTRDAQDFTIDTRATNLGVEFLFFGFLIPNPNCAMDDSS